MTTLGIVLAYVAGLFTSGVTGGWRIIFGIPAALALLRSWACSTCRARLAATAGSAAAR